MQFLRDNLADRREPANAGNAFVHTIVTQVASGIEVIHQYARLAVLNAARDRH